MDIPVRHVGIPPLEPGDGAVLRFAGVRHSTESFTVRVFLGRWSGQELEQQPEAARDALAGTVGLYGHGQAYGSQDQLDQTLLPFDAEVELTPALDRRDGPVDAVTLTVTGADRRPRPADLFRYEQAVVRPER